MVEAEDDAGGDDPGEEQGVQHLLAGDLHRLSRDQPLELAEGDVRPPERDRADHHGEERRHERVEGYVAPNRQVMAERRPRDQRDRAAADAVVKGNHLRHRCHLHAPRRDHAHGGADAQADHDQSPVADPLEREGRRYGDRHPSGRNQVALLCGRRVRPAADPEDEQGERHDVTDLHEARLRIESGEDGHAHPSFSESPSEDAFSSFGSFLGFRTNMPSIRSVTMKPPTMLIVPKAIAIVPIRLSSQKSESPTTIRPPSSTMPWIALVCDIRGVWSVVGTFEITSKPTNAASTKIVISVMSGIRR